MLTFELEKKEFIMLDLNSEKKPLIRINSVLNEFDHIEDDIRDDINKIRVDKITRIKLYDDKDPLIHFLCIYNYQTKKFAFKLTDLTNSDFTSDKYLHIDDDIDVINSLVVRMDFSAKTTPTQTITTDSLDELTKTIAVKIKRKITSVIGSINRLPIDKLYSSEKYGCALAKVKYQIGVTILNRKWFIPLNAFSVSDLRQIFKFLTNCCTAVSVHFDFSKYYDLAGLQSLIDDKQFNSIFSEYKDSLELKKIDKFVDECVENPSKLLEMTFAEIRQMLNCYYEPDNVMAHIIKPVLKRNESIDVFDTLKMWNKYRQDFSKDRLELAKEQGKMLTTDILSSYYSGPFDASGFDYNVGNDIFRVKDKTKMFKVYFALNNKMVTDLLFKMIEKQAIIDDYGDKADKVLVIPSKEFLVDVLNEKLGDIPHDVFEQIMDRLKENDAVKIITVDELFERNDVFEIKENMLNKELLEVETGFDTEADLSEVFKQGLVFTKNSWAYTFPKLALHKI